MWKREVFSEVGFFSFFTTILACDYHAQGSFIVLNATGILAIMSAFQEAGRM